MIKQQKVDKEMVEFTNRKREGTDLSTADLIKIMFLMTAVFFCFTSIDASHDKAKDKEDEIRKTCQVDLGKIYEK